MVKDGAWRSVPELALKESFVAREGPILPGTLEGLVEFARRSKALPNALATKADRIRVLGNKAVHRGGCSDQEALETIQSTSEVLEALYGGGGSNGMMSP
ncbi:MAG: DUF4145 domain-containing protein [Deltaproteobacteria bacterium]|nr:DUF4145 domain-containing protein [Deltaproteobacteria bacterium]